MKESEEKANGHLMIAKIYGTANLSLGVTTAISSLLSLGFTYYSNPNISIIFSFASTITATILTALNPSQRESRRRKFYHYKITIRDEARTGLRIVNGPVTQDTFLEISKIEEQIAYLNREMSQLEDVTAM